MDGILSIHKAPGMTSHDVVAKVRKLCQQRRVGHTGTLDPAASGVLPICLGQATRVAEYLSESGKAYMAQITLGIVTDTYDAEGTVLQITPAPAIANISYEQIEQTMVLFLGQQMQMPPRYSAIKIQGQPAYKLARAGQEVTLEPRPIVISSLQILSWQAPILTLAIECSKGTYIRSLAYDLGEKLGCGAHMSGLIRTRSGPFTLADSITLEQVAELIAQGTLETHLFPPDIALQQYPAVFVDAEIAERILHGNPFSPTDIETSTPPSHELARIYAPNGQFLAIATWDVEHQTWQPRKVLT